MKNTGLSFIITIALLVLIMIPVSAAICSTIQTLGAHRESQIHTMSGYRLTKAEKADPRFVDLSMFPKNTAIYRVKLEKGKAKYVFYASLPNPPDSYVNKIVQLKFNHIVNSFGRYVDIEGTARPNPLPTSIGIPVYGDFSP